MVLVILLLDFFVDFIHEPFISRQNINGVLWFLLDINFMSKHVVHSEVLCNFYIIMMILRKYFFIEI